MSALWRQGAFNLWPQSLFGRIALVLFCGLAAAHLLTLSLLLYERSQTMGAMMIAYLAKDVASSIAVLERLPAAERAQWLPRIERRNYRYVLSNEPAGAATDSAVAREIAALLTGALASPHKIRMTAPRDAADPLQLYIHLELDDHTPLTIELIPPGIGISAWVLAALALQIFLLGLFTWLAVRIATKPLVRLAKAADALGADLQGPQLPENGPREVAHAAVAFNAMQRRIRDHLAEHVRILAAISHDLQSPITRMRLRADLVEDANMRRRLQSDLAAMQTLVTEGLDFARSLHGRAETPVATDVQALLESLTYDYTDAGQKVCFKGRVDTPLLTRPQILRRIIANLVDNALKFAGDAEISVAPVGADAVVIVVRDRGPGIADEQLQAVLRPFYRLEQSRNRETGGTGLGLAIAAQLCGLVNGRLQLANHPAGGLVAELIVAASHA